MATEKKETADVFERINSWVRSIESSIVNLISAIAPWLAPIAPAYMTYDHAANTLHFPTWVSLPIAIVVEILGFSAISTFMSFWLFNRRNKAEGKKAPVSFVIFAFIFYLALIVTSNILLDATNKADWAIISVKALYTLQTIPAALIVISRVGHKDLLADIKSERATNEANRSPNRSQGNEQDANDSQENESGGRTYDSLSQSDKYFVLNSLSKVIAKEYHVGVRSAQKWKVRVQEEVTQGKL
jgi:hypothetical protein